MKLFAIITAGLMATGGATYFLHGDSQCPFSQNCPVAKTGCCPSTVSTPNCAGPCSGCDTGCASCCDVCDLCCGDGAHSAVKHTPVVAKSDCCASGDVCCEFGAACCLTSSNVSAKTAKPDCCASGEVCCEFGAACCLSATQVSAKPTVPEPCCEQCLTPAKLGESAAVAGVSLK